MSGRVRAPLAVPGVAIPNAGAPSPAVLNGLCAYSSDVESSATTVPTIGSIYATKLWVPEPSSYSVLWASITAAGTALTAAECWAALYSMDGQTQLAAPVDISSGAWDTVGVAQSLAIAGAAVQPPFVWCMTLWNGTTAPTFRASTNNAGASTMGPVGTGYRYQLVAVGPNTTLPATFNPQAGTRSGMGAIIGLS